MAGNLFIALEGLSGTGKTCVGEILADAIHGTMYKTPPSPFRDIRDDIDQACGLAARYFFYLAGVIHASAQIKKLLQTTPVVCDRYILTTYCYHGAAGVKAVIPLEQLELLKPDLTVLITCDEEERMRRLAQRGLTYNDSVEQAMAISRSFLQAYRKHDVLEIDSTAISPKEVASRIIKAAKSLC